MQNQRKCNYLSFFRLNGDYMESTNIILSIILLLIIGGALFYIIREKKKGRKCIGCPHSKSCCGKCGDNDFSKENNL